MRGRWLRGSPVFIMPATILTIIISTLLWQGGITVFGRVYQPGGQSAVRAKVKIEIVNGFSREIWSDDQGNFEFRGIPAGRYRLSATNPEAAEQFSEPAESDSTRSFANRLQVNLYLRLPVKVGPGPAPPGTISVEESAQRVPGAARKALEQGRRLLADNRSDEALAQFDRAIDAYPDYYQALTERANLLVERSRLDEASNDFERALRLNGKYAPALRGYGYCLIQQGRFAAALAPLEQSYALASDVPLTLLLLGYANLSLGRKDPARQCLLESLRLDEKGAARAHVYLGEILAGEGKFAPAADELERYLRLKPGAADAGPLRQRQAEWRERAGK